MVEAVTLTSLRCEEVRELLPAYALDALSDPEQYAVRQHLSECGQHSELQSLRATAAALAARAPQVEPPRWLRDRVVGVARPTAAAFDVPPLVGSPRLSRDHPQTRRWLMIAGAVVAALVIAGVAWSVGRMNTDGRSLVGSTQNTQGSSMRVLYIEQPATIVMRFVGLPRLTERVYQVWVIRNSTPVTLGQFDSDVDGAVDVVMEGSLRSGDTVAITVEPPAGSVAPSSTPLLEVTY